MSQRTRRSLAETAAPSTPTRVTRNKSLAPDAAGATTTPQKLTRKSLALAESAAEVKTPTRRTRTSSVSSITSDVSEIGSESGRVTRRSSRLSGIKLEEPAELPLGRKRTSSISSVTSETPSLSKATTKKSIAGAKDTPTKKVDDASSVVKPKLLDGGKHEDSPFKGSSTRKSTKLSLTTVEENEADSKNKGKLSSTQQFEEITFSSDDESQATSKSKALDRKRKSILPTKNDFLKTIDEDENEVVNVEVTKSPKSPKKELLQKHMKGMNTPEKKKADSEETSPRVNLNRINATNVSPNLILDRLDSKTKSPTTPDKKRKSKGNEVAEVPSEKSPAPNSNKKNKKSIENQANKPSETENTLPGNLKRKSSEKSNLQVTPRKSMENLKRKSSGDQQAEIDFEEIVLDDEDDIVMEDVKTSNTSKDLNQSIEKSPKKRKSMNETVQDGNDAGQSKKRKSMDEGRKELNEAVEEDKENKESTPAKVKETFEEKMNRIVMENKLAKAKKELEQKRIAKIKISKRKRQSKKDKMRIKERRQKRLNANQAVVASDTPKVEAIQKSAIQAVNVAKKPQDKVDKEPQGTEDEQRKLEKILAKKALKKEKWMKRLAEKKAVSLAKKKEEMAAAKAVRKNIYETNVAAKVERLSVGLKKKQSKKMRQKERKKLEKKTETPVIKNPDGKPNITLSDIVAKLDEMTKPKAVLKDKNDTDNNTIDENLRGKAKSGRFWKETKDKFSTMVKTPGLRRPHSEKEKLRAEIKHNKEMTRHILETQARAKEEHRQRRAENIKRREENARKSEIVQVIKNAAKLKRMKKKQLRLIEKRDTLPIIEKRKSAAAESL